ncbi:MAG: CinA family protein [bacterium]
MNTLALSAARLLSKNGLSLSVCESCTGGMLGSVITEVPGSSKYFKGGIIAYSNEVKRGVVGVKTKTLRKFGAVSEQTAQQMAQGVRRIIKTDIGISITGIAGPAGGTRGKPVGTVFIGIADNKKTRIYKFHFKGNRNQIRKRVCIQALKLLVDHINSNLCAHS